MDKRRGLKARLEDAWLSYTLKGKINAFTAMVICMLVLFLGFGVVTINFALSDFNEILKETSDSSGFQTAFKAESDAFKNYIRSRTEKNMIDLKLACIRTERELRSLPQKGEAMSSRRRAQTWSIQNTYENYQAKRDHVLSLPETDEDYITELYEVYTIQDWMDVYANRLTQLAIEDGSARYEERVPFIKILPFLLVSLSALVLTALLALAKMMKDTFVTPVIRLAEESRRIAESEFSGPELTVKNRDEIGELVTAFGKMKRATERYITTLNERNEMAVLLHKGEIEKLELEKQLDATRLELLKSQINPHFLFNTLNMITCMAKLEEADTTGRMIAALSNLFRYTLKSTGKTAPLIQELRVVEDYVYIQKMRFGSRIQCSIDCKKEVENARIPVYSLQPLVENAIIHGLSKKESGGRITIRAWQRENRVVISICDTGVGMSEERLLELREALGKKVRSATAGIGLGNICRRVTTMYGEQGRFSVYSRKDHGTLVQMEIPNDWAGQEGEKEE